jgi:chromosome segregation ATPase
MIPTRISGIATIRHLHAASLPTTHLELQRLQEELRSAEAALAITQGEKAQAESEALRLANEVRAQTEQLARLEEMAGNGRQETSRLQTELAQQSEELTLLRGRLADRDAVATRAEQLATELQTLRAGLAEAANAVGPDGATDHSGEVVLLREQMRASEENAQRLQTEYARIQEELTQRTQEIAALSEALRQAQEALTAAGLQLSELTAAKDQVVALTEKVAALELLVADREQQSQDLATLAAKLTASEEMRSNLTLETEQRLAAQKLEWETQLAAITAEWEAKVAGQQTELDARIAGLTAEAEQKLAQAALDLEALKVQIQAEHEARVAEITAGFEATKQGLEEQIAERERNIARMKQNQVKATELITERNRNIAELKSKCELLEAERTQLQIRSGELTQRLESLVSTDQSNASLIGAHTATIASLETQLRNANEEQSRLRRRIEDLQANAVKSEDTASRASEARIAELERIVNDKVRRSELEHQRLLDELAASQSDLASMSKEVQGLTELLRRSERSLSESVARAPSVQRPPPEPIAPPPPLPQAPRQQPAAHEEANAKEGDADGSGRAHSKVAATLLDRAENLEQRRQMVVSVAWAGLMLIALIVLCSFVVYWLL